MPTMDVHLKPVIIGAVLIVIAVVFMTVRAMAAGEPQRSPNPPDEMYSGLRGLALGTSAADLGLEQRGEDQPYGIVMDLGLDEGRTATVTSFATGDASLYLSTGGGTIGSGQASQDVAAAAKRFVDAAKPYVPSMTKVSEYKLPGSGDVTFYVLTSGGVFTAVRHDGVRDNFSPLFEAGQDVLTQIRLLQERQEAERP
jgi:hypothetical protein